MKGTPASEQHSHLQLKEMFDSNYRDILLALVDKQSSNYVPLR